MLWHALLIFSVAWPGLRAVVHAHDQYAGQPNSCQSLADHVSRYHSGGSGGAAFDCLDCSFFQWHVHWTMVGLTATPPGELGQGTPTISPPHPPTFGFGSAPLPAVLLVLPPAAGPSLANALRTFSRTAQAPSPLARVQFCVWLC